MLLLLSPVPFLCVLLVISRRNQNLVQNVKKLARLPKIHQPAEVCYFGVKQYKPKVITEALAFLGDWQLIFFLVSSWCFSRWRFEHMFFVFAHIWGNDPNLTRLDIFQMG